MSESFYKLLKPFIWPRYYEEGPPGYIDVAFLSRDILDNNDRIREPVKSILDLVIFGYRPITGMSILLALVENGNKPMYGSQIGAQLEKRFELPKGWFTRTRYYDTRIAKLLKILHRQNILDEVKVKDLRTNKELVGYRIGPDIYLGVKERTSSLLRGDGLQIFASLPKGNHVVEEPKTSKHCSKCNFLSKSRAAKFCELCGATLVTLCQGCGKEVCLEYSFCLNCGKKIEQL
jgi:hypothetical protein